MTGPDHASSAVPSPDAGPATVRRPTTRLTHRRVLALVWPVVLAQAATAITGVVDTLLMGRFGDKSDLAAVGLASVTFSFVYWGFGFLRMSTTGLTAQAQGANDEPQARAHLVRALVIGGALGTAITLSLPFVRAVALWAFDAAADVEGLAASYFEARIWGAPAALMGYAITGWLLGTGRTRSLLLFQVVLNGVNALLDTWFAATLEWGPAGIGAGTAVAEWVALGLGLVLVRDGFGRAAPLWERSKLRALFVANRDILVRTLALLFSFGWFANSGAKVGTAALAGNQVLLQFIAVAAFVLDAFAFVAEKEVGEAVGAADVGALRRAMRVTTGLAFAAALAISAAFWVFGAEIIVAFVVDDAARRVALAYLPYCAVVPAAGVIAWQLDGAFLGATGGAALRTAALLATTAYVCSDLLLASRWGNTGVWIAFVAMYGYRAVSLAAFWPALVRSVLRPGNELVDPQGSSRG